MTTISFARRLSWELTKRCDRACGHCISALYHETLPEELGPEQALRVLRRCEEAGVGEVHFLGGEPTLRPDLPDLLRRCDELGLRTSLTTSGSRLDEGLVSVLARTAGLRALVVSFEDVREAEQDAIRGPGAFAAACEGVRRIRRAAPDLAVPIAFTMGRPALESLSPDRILGFFAELGASRVVFQDLAVPGPARPSLARLALDGPLWLGFLERLYAVGTRPRSGLPFSYGPKPLVAEHLRERVGAPAEILPYECRAGDRDLRLLPNGTLLPCSAAVGWPGALARSVAETPPLPEASLDDALAAAFHRRFAACRDRAGADPTMEPCRRCHLAYVRCNPCPYGRLVGEEHIVQPCAWVFEERERKATTRRTGRGGRRPRP